MKKITFIFFTLCGINTCFSQKPAETPGNGQVSEIIPTNTTPVSPDSIAVKAKPAIRLFPNPAKNKVEIDISGFYPGYVKLQLVDNKGKLVREERRQVFSGSEIIVLMFSEKPGLYYVLVKQGESTTRTKLVIQ